MLTEPTASLPPARATKMDDFEIIAVITTVAILLAIATLTVNF